MRPRTVHIQMLSDLVVFVFLTDFNFCTVVTLVYVFVQVFEGGDAIADLHINCVICISVGDICCMAPPTCCEDDVFDRWLRVVLQFCHCFDAGKWGTQGH